MKLLCYVCIIFTFTITLHLILQNLYSEIFWKQCSDKTGKKFIFFLANNPRYLWLMVRMDEKWTKYAQHVRMRAFLYSLDLCTIFADAKKMPTIYISHFISVLFIFQHTKRFHLSTFNESRSHQNHSQFIWRLPSFKVIQIYLCKDLGWLWSISFSSNYNLQACRLINIFLLS